MGVAQNEVLATEAKAIIETYTTLYESGQKKAARAQLEQGLKLLEGSSVDTLIGTFYNLYTNWHFYEGNLDTALQLQIVTAQYFERGYGEAEPTAFALHNVGFLYSRVLGQADSALHYYNRGLEIYLALDRPLDIADEYRNIGIINARKKDFAAAQRAYLQAMQALQRMQAGDIDALPKGDQLLYAKTLSWLYLNMARLKREMDDMRQVRVYMEYSQDVLARFVDRFPELELEMLENQGRMYDYLELRDERITAFLDFYAEVDPADRNTTTRALSLIVDAYQRDEQFEQAIKYGERLQEYEGRFPAKVPIRQARNTRALSSAYLDAGYLGKAKISVEELEKILQGVPEPQERAMLHLMKSRVHRAEGNYRAALLEADIAIDTYDFSGSAAFATLQALKSDLYFSLYQAEGQLVMLDSSEYWARSCWSNLLRFEAETFQRRSFGKHYRRPTECLLNVLYERYRLNPQPEILEEILKYQEAGRGRSLKLGRQWQTSGFFANPVRVGIRQRYLSLLSERYRLEEEVPNSEAIYTLNDSLVLLGRQLDSFRLQLLGDRVPDLSIAELQRGLPGRKSCLLLYFAGKDHWFAMGITKGEVVLHRAAVDPAFTQLLKDFKEEVRAMSSSTELLAETSFLVYEKVLAPLLAKISTPTNRLLISADGIFSAVPWPATCSAPPQGDDFRTWPFLVKDYSIVALTHAADVLHGRTLNRQDFSVACFAPVYPERVDTVAERKLSPLLRNDFWALPGAKEEARAIQQLYGAAADLFASQQLDRAAFVDQVKAYNVLHLAMHAVADRAYPDESFLLFPGKTGSLEYLTALDLLSVGVDADLLVLSACYTGEGPWRPGDGVMSLAYALRQAGAEAVLSNYWATADEFSKDLMLTFHQRIKAGESLDVALQAAQQDFLEQARLPQVAHPFYWAGFHLQGSTSPLDINASSWRWWYWLMVIGAVVLLYWIASRRAAARS